MLLNKNERDQSFPESGGEKEKLFFRLAEQLDMSIKAEEQRIAHQRCLCEKDASMIRLCDLSAELLGELTRLNRSLIDG